MRKLLAWVWVLCQFVSVNPLLAETPEPSSRKIRIGTIYFSETFINEQIKKHLNLSESVKSLEVDLKQEGNTLRVHGIYQLPFDDLESLGLDPKMAQFKFQLSVTTRVNEEGYLVLEFPVEESFFHQATASGKSARDRVMIPVQLLSLGLASVRNQLAALSGDFSGLDKKRDKLGALLRGLDGVIAKEENSDAKRALLIRKETLKLQLASEKLEREQLESTGESLRNIMNLLGAGEFNLNNKLKASGNKLILKVKLSSLISYLKDVELGRVRIQHKDRYGKGEDYFALDIDSKAMGIDADLPERLTIPSRKLAVPPSLLIRLNQEILLKQAIKDKKSENLSEKVEDFKLVFRDDGLHVTGKAKVLFFKLPFDSLIDFVSTDADVFEIRVRKLKVLGIGMKFLVPMALSSVQSRLEPLFKDLCTYEYLGKVDETRAIQVKMDSQKLVPAFPGLHLVDIDVLDGSIMLRIGRKEGEMS